MKNLAKVLALVLALTMVMSTFAFASNPFEDVSDEATYAEAVTMLSDLGILAGYEEDGATYFKPDQTITRAEVAKIIVCALGAEDASAGASNLNLYSDVPASHWAAGYVNYISGFNNIIAGYGNGKFGPSDEVLYEQVIKMVVCALGYYPMAMQRGGYPTGFLAVASELGLTKGASGSAGEPAKRWVVARIVYNALTVALMKQTGWDINNPEYTITGTGDYEEETLLEDYLDVVKVNGIVTETFFQGDVDKDNLTVTIEGLSKDDAIAVNDDEDNRSITIDIGNTEAQNYHGYAVTAYIYTDEDSDEQKLLAIAPRGTRNTVTVVDLDDLDDMTAKDVNSSKKYATVNYEDANGKDSSVKVDLNGVFYVNLVEEEVDDIVSFINSFEGENGTITFIQNETSDQYADYVFVEYFNGVEYVITEINSNKSKVSYEYMNGSSVKKTGSEVLDADDDDTWVFFYKNGKSIDFDALKEGNVISKIMNNDNPKSATVTKVYVSDETVEGKISSVSTGKGTATIAGTKYDYAQGIFSSSSIGKSGIAYLNVNGKVVFFDETEGSTSNDDYALFFSAAQEDDKWGTSTVVSMRVLDSNGKWNEYDFADKVTVKYGDNEYKTSDINDFLDKCDYLTDGMIAFDSSDKDKFVGHVCVIQYKLNTSGKVSTLVVPESGALSDEYLSAKKYVNVEYKDEDATLGKLNVSDDAIIFTYNGGATNDEDSYAVSSVSSVFTDEDKYDFTALVSKDGDIDEPNCFYVITEGTRAKVNSRLMVVSEAGEEENKDGDAQASIAGYINGNEDEKTFFVDDDYTIGGMYSDMYSLMKSKSFEYDDLEEGDVIAVSFDSDGEICDIVVVMLAADVKAGDVSDYPWAKTGDKTSFYFSGENNNGKDVEFMFGYVAEAATSKAGVKYFDLSKAFDNNVDDVDDIEKIARVRENKLTGNVYYVDLSKKNISIEVSNNFDDVQANNINLKNGDTVKGGEGYFMYAQTFEGDIVDAVVFIVDCADFFAE
jgi:hypothetical protein